LTIAILIGYRYDITLWDWIKLLIVPAVIAGGGIWFNRQQRERELEIAREQREREVEIADGRAQEEALQAYLDQIGNLLLEKDRPLRQSKERDEVRTLARARTLTVLRRLDGERKASVLQFLYESGLISKNRVVVDLGGADLNEAKLSEANLEGANLSEAKLGAADLRQATLGGANLRNADLRNADLRYADLREADLRVAELISTDLRYADLRNADLSDLRYADLSEAELRVAKLGGAKLREADLSGATGITNEELEQQAYARFTGTALLTRTIMPNGQKYEVWLKDREGRKEKGENE
jgi:hypothetical protein